jgi:hypothetical protein
MYSLSDYEAWLDKLDKHMFIKGDEIFIDFGRPYSVPLTTCTSTEDLIDRACHVSIMLLEDKDVHISYLAKRFIRLASSALGLIIDADKLYKEHVLLNIGEVVLKERGKTKSRVDSLLFENISGIYIPGTQFFRLQRPIDSVTEEFNGPLVLSRNMIGNNGYQQQTAVETIQLIHTKTHITFCLPPTTIWRTNYPEKYGSYEWLEATRIALHHNFTAEQLADIDNDLSGMLAGLEFSSIFIDTPALHMHSGLTFQHL